MKARILILAVLYCSAVSGQWTRVHPDGGNIYSIVAVGNTLFNGTEIGVYKSSDGGNTWETANNGLTILVVKVLFVKGTTLYAGTRGGGIFRSDDLAGTWVPSGTGLTGTIVKSIVENEYGMFAGTTDAGVFLSTDEGGYWSQVNSGITNIEINALTVNGDVIYAGSEGSGVFKSTDNGASWTVMTQGLASWYISSLYTMDSRVFAGTLYGLYMLDENGTTFINVNGIIQSEVLAFCHDGSTLYAGSNGGGVYFSDDFVTSWTTWSEGLVNKNIYSLCIFNEEAYAGTCCGFGLWKRELPAHTGLINTLGDFAALFPNPASSCLSMKAILPGETDALIRIISIDGEIKWSNKSLISAGELNETIPDLSFLAPGTYICSIKAGDYRMSRIFIVR
jgi:hypothetical protein